MSFDIFGFMHDGQSPFVLASKRSVLDRNGFEVVVSDVESEGGSFPKAIYLGERTGAYTTDLEVGIIVEINPVGVTLG